MFELREEVRRLLSELKSDFLTYFEIKSGFANAMLEVIKCHLLNLSKLFPKYFPHIEKEDKTHNRIINPFDTTTATLSELPNTIKDNLIDMSTDSILKATFKKLSLCNSWTTAHQAFKELSDTAMSKLLPLSSTCVNTASLH
ncbi:hypothetical protein PR048_004245 [Dryococelus australis]|uniref:Uncharacterized protein n=1 Tax=Dryococelus australis TaxID=614101 RepID=A0ABQ9I4Y3_9NEOP|nr:hypothetical protein PR048_004245 [Dryococelus australis]